MILTIPLADLKPYERLSNGALVTGVEHHDGDTTTVTTSKGSQTVPTNWEIDIWI